MLVLVAREYGRDEMVTVRVSEMALDQSDLPRW